MRRITLKRGALTQFASAAGVSVGFASLLLTGKKVAGDELCHRLAELTGSDPCLWRFGSADERTAAVMMWIRRSERGVAK